MKKKVVLPLLVSSALSVGMCWADEPQEKGKSDYSIAVVVNSDDSKPSSKQSDETPNKLWLGVGLKSIEGDLSDYLGSDKGVLIEDVYDNSPAGKSGILKGDLLLSVDGTELAGPADLLKFMKSAKEDQALTLKIRRKNEEMEIKVTPAARPQEFVMGLDLNKEMGDSKLRFHVDPAQMQVFRMGHPAGIFVPQWAPLKGDLKMNLSTNSDGKSVEVKIVREGDKPAEITVTKDGETKKYTEEQLGEIPEEIQGLVGGMLKPGNHSIVGLSHLNNLKEGFKLDAEDFKAHLDAFKKEGSLHGTHEALKHALDEVAAGAAQAKAASDVFNSPELRKQLDEIRVRVTAEASEAVAKATAEAKKAMEDAQKRATEASSAAKQRKNDKSEVEELRSLVDELKKEIAELRAANQKEKK